MPGPTIDAKWLLGIVFVMLSALGSWMRFETQSLRQHTETSAQNVLAQAKAHSNDERAGRFTSEEFNLAMQFRDTDFDKVEILNSDNSLRLAALNAIVQEYRDWTQQLAARVRNVQTTNNVLTGHITRLQARQDQIEKELATVKLKQDDVRETRIPKAMQLIESHLAKPQHSPGVRP